MRKLKLEVKGIILDLDGTIVDSTEAYVEAAKAAFAAAGQENVDIRIATEIPRRLEQKLSIDNLIKGIDTQKFLHAFLKSYYKVTALKTKPMPDVSETLEKLSRRASLALVTMRHVRREKVVEELEKFGLAKHFGLVVTALDACRPKPSPEALIYCAKQLGVRISECAVVGDSITDVRAGRNAGAKTVAVLSGIFTREELEKEKPDLMLESVNELSDFLE